MGRSYVFILLCKEGSQSVRFVYVFFLSQRHSTVVNHMMHVYPTLVVKKDWYKNPRGLDVWGPSAFRFGSRVERKPLSLTHCLPMRFRFSVLSLFKNVYKERTRFPQMTPLTLLKRLLPKINLWVSSLLENLPAPVPVSLHYSRLFP